MNHEITKSKVISSLLWKLLERGGVQGIQFIVTIVLARILLPKDFGLIVLIMIFISVAGIFVQSGFNTALIQKKDADDVDFSSVFYVSLIVSLLLYIVLFFSAPFLATFFDQPEFVFILRILSLTLFFGAINTVQLAIISRNMQFKRLFISSFGAVITSGIIGIVMAYDSFGIWALVGQQITNQLMITIILWFTVRWRPQFIFSVTRIKSLFSFGWKLLVSALLNTLTTNLQSLLVGKVFSPAILGFFNRGEQFPTLIINNIDGSIQSVLLPTLVSHQNDRQKVKEIMRRSIVTSSFIIFPIMVGLAVIAEPLIKLLLTDKWLPAVPIMQIFCASYALWPIHTANLQVMNALGRSDLFLKLEIIKVVLNLIILGIGINFGVFGIVWGGFASSVLSTLINAYPNQKLISYSFLEQWKDIFPSLLLSLVMGILIYTIHWFGLVSIFTIILQVLFGVIIYIGLARRFKIECLTYLLITLKDMRRNKRNHVC